MSHYASSHNIVFKITVPKRTGRKRKRGSDEPWQGHVEEAIQDASKTPSATLLSRAKLDEPRILRRKLQDNSDRYKAEAVGIIKHTHRYRGMVDFNYSMKNNSFMNGFTEKIVSGDGTTTSYTFCGERALTSSGSIKIPTTLHQARDKHNSQPGNNCTAADDPDHRPLLLSLLPKPIRESSGQRRRWL